MLLCVGLLGLKGLGRDCLAPQIAIGLQLFLHVFLVVDHVLVLRKVTVGLRQKGSVIRLIILLFRYLAEKEPPLVDLPLERLLLHLELLLLGREKPRAVAAGGSGQGGVRWCGNYNRTITILFFHFLTLCGAHRVLARHHWAPQRRDPCGSSWRDGSWWWLAGQVQVIVVIVVRGRGALWLGFLNSRSSSVHLPSFGV